MGRRASIGALDQAAASFILCLADRATWAEIAAFIEAGLFGRVRIQGWRKACVDGICDLPEVSS